MFERGAYILDSSYFMLFSNKMFKICFQVIYNNLESANLVAVKSPTK